MADPKANTAFDSQTEQIGDTFDRDGFAVIEGLALPDDLVRLRLAYDDLLEGRVDCGSCDRHLGGLTRQIMMPHLLHEAFSNNSAVIRAQKIAERLVRCPAPELMFSMAINKPSGHPHETPWHQDVAYAKLPFSPAGTTIPFYSIAQFWLALDDVERDMGCMEYVPGSHLIPMKEHIVSSGDPDDVGRLLALRDPESQCDLSTKVICPLKAGSATVHSYCTAHYTGPNRSKTRSRPAFIFSYWNPDVYIPARDRLNASVLES